MSTQRTYFMKGAGVHPYLYYVLIAQVLLVSVCFRGLQTEERGWSSLLAFTFLVPSFAFMQGFFGIVALLCSFSIFAQIAKLNAVSSRLFLLAEAGTLVALVAFLARHFEAREISSGICATVVAPLLQAFGFQADVNGGLLFLTKGEITQKILLSEDKLALNFFAIFLTSLFWILFRTGSISFRRVAISGCLCLAYMLARMAFICCWFFDFGQFNWWNEIFVFWSLLPFFLLTYVFLAQNSIEGLTARRQAGSNGVYVAISFSLLVIVSFVSIAEIPVAKTGGTILIDEKYSDWEWSDSEFTTNSYGVKTVYAYSSMVDYLSHFYDVRINHHHFDEATLSDVSVLILKTPTQPYPAEEVDLLVDFVKLGGSIWFIGDHTNIFGMDSYLNQVSVKFGIRFNYDSVVDPECNRQLMRPTWTGHPITANLPLFLWYTGDSLTAPLLQCDALRSGRLLCDDPDFSVNTYFGDFAPSPSERVGEVTQIAAFSVGEGRVAAWSDSTLFSNFSFYMPGKRELAVGFLEWCRTRSLPRHVTLPLIAICLIAVAIMVTKRFVTLGDTVLLLLAAISAATACNGVLNAIWYRPVAIKALSEIAFVDSGPESGRFPRVTTFDKALPEGCLTAFVSSQRVGKHPYVSDGIPRDQRAEKIVLTGRVPFTAGDISYLKQYVEGGGTLIILDLAMFSRNEAKKLTDAFQLKCHALQIDQQATLLVENELDRIESELQRLVSRAGYPLTDKTGNDAGFGRSVYVFSNGEGLLFQRRGNEMEKVLISERVGLGRVYVCGGAGWFSDYELGETSEVPNKRQLCRLDLLFKMFQ